MHLLLILKDGLKVFNLFLIFFLDLGQDLLIDTIRITKPTLLVQLSHFKSHSKLDINLDLICSHSGFYTQPNYFSSKFSPYILKFENETEIDLTLINNQSNTSSDSYSYSMFKWKFKPYELRICSIIQYFFSRYDNHCRFLLPFIKTIPISLSYYKVTKFDFSNIYLSFIQNVVN